MSLEDKRLDGIVATAIEYLEDLLNDLQDYYEKGDKTMCGVTILRINAYTQIILHNFEGGEE